MNEQDRVRTMFRGLTRYPWGRAAAYAIVIGLAPIVLLIYVVGGAVSGACFAVRALAQDVRDVADL